LLTSLRHLSYLVAVADHGSITAAAEHLRISQPAVSAALRDIESEFDLSLFIRQRPHKITMTAIGRRFVSNAKQLLESAHEFDVDVRNLRENLQGVVEFGCFAPTAPFVIPIVIDRLKEKYPGLKIKLHEGDIDELNRLLTEGQIDLALTYDMYLDSSIKFEPLTEAPPYVLLAADDPLAKQKSVSLKDLAQRDMISFDLPVTQQYFHSLFIQNNLRPRIKHQVKGYEMVRSLVGAGEGFSLLIMRPVNKRTYAGDELAYRKLSDDISPPRYGLTFTTHYRPTRLVEAVANVCRELLTVDNQLDDFLVD